MAKKKKKKGAAGGAAAPKPDLVADIMTACTEVCEAGEVQYLANDSLKIKLRGVISTQSLSLDRAIGRGGIPRGRLTILHGAEGSGKSTIAMHLIAEVQRVGGVAVYIDKEYKMDPDYAATIGVNIDDLIYTTPRTLERCFELMEGVCLRSKATGNRKPIVLVLDSMNAARTKTQIEGDYGADVYSPQARVYSACIPKLMEVAAGQDVALLFISQIRKKIGVMWGDPDAIAGGESAAFYASLILKVKRIGFEKIGLEKSANRVQVECAKNQIAAPFKKAVLQIDFGKGINRAHSVLSTAIDTGLIEKSGNTYSYKGEILGVGSKKAAKTLAKHSSLRSSIELSVRESAGW